MARGLQDTLRGQSKDESFDYLARNGNPNILTKRAQLAAEENPAVRDAKEKAIAYDAADKLKVLQLFHESVCDFVVSVGCQAGRGLITNRHITKMFFCSRGPIDPMGSLIPMGPNGPQWAQGAQGAHGAGMTV